MNENLVVCRQLRDQSELTVLKLGHLEFEKSSTKRSNKWIRIALQNVSSPSIHTIEIAIVFGGALKDERSALGMFEWKHFKKMLSSSRFPVLKMVKIHLTINKDVKLVEDSLVRKIRRRMSGLPRQWSLKFVVNDKNDYPEVPSFRV